MSAPHTKPAPSTAVLDVADLVVEFVRERRGGVTFVEIERRLAALGFPTKGHLALTIESKNIALWFGMSQPFVRLMEQLRLSGRLEVTPTSWLVYALDGALPSMPVAVRPPAGGYKRPRWLPVVFNLPRGQR